MKKLFLLIASLLTFNAFANGWADNYLYVYHYVESRAPTATEDDLNQFFIDNNVSIETFNTQFYWYDTADQSLYDYINGANGSLIWKKRGSNTLVFSTFTPVIADAYQLSESRNVQLSCSVKVELSANSSGNIYLDYADNNVFDVNLITPSLAEFSSTSETETINTAVLSAIIPAGKYVRERSIIESGTVVFTPLICQAVQL